MSHSNAPSGQGARVFDRPLDISASSDPVRGLQWLGSTLAFLASLPEYPLWGWLFHLRLASIGTHVSPAPAFEVVSRTPSSASESSQADAEAEGDEDDTISGAQYKFTPHTVGLAATAFVGYASVYLKGVDTARLDQAKTVDPFNPEFPGNTGSPQWL